MNPPIWYRCRRSPSGWARCSPRAGHQLHLVGGPIRDALLGRSPDPAYLGDLDFTTDARPERVLELVGQIAEATWTTGIEFGTVGALVDGQRCEITTFRADRYDRVSRNPQVALWAFTRGRPAPPRLHDERDGLVGDR